MSFKVKDSPPISLISRFFLSFILPFTLTIIHTDNILHHYIQGFKCVFSLYENVCFRDSVAGKTSKQKNQNACWDFYIDFVGQSSQKCSKIFLKVSQRSSSASGNHCEHLVSTLAMFILQESLAINRLNPQMPWPYLEWNILSSLLSGPAEHQATRSDRAWRCSSESVMEDVLPLYQLFLMKQAVPLFCFFMAGWFWTPVQTVWTLNLELQVRFGIISTHKHMRLSGLFLAYLHWASFTWSGH